MFGFKPLLCVVETRCLNGRPDLQNICKILLLFMILVLEANAEEYIVDPVRGMPSGDGSALSPWQSIQVVLNERRLRPGDTVYLRSGQYGHLEIRDHRSDRTVRIFAEPGQLPKFDGLRVLSSASWHLRGLHIGPSVKPYDGRKAIVEIGQGSENITLEGSTISTAPDTTGWSADDWRRRALHGILASGQAIILRGNHIKNVRHGIHSEAHRSVIERNLIENFAGDGIRGLGDHTVYQFNTIKNCYKVDDNHDDGFQSWSVGPDGAPGTGEVVGGVVRGNRIINYEDPNQSMRCTLQGIGLFDGFFVDWVIENNVVVTDHWHGITVMGARGVRIVNNTVIDPNERRPGPPWIRITDHKNGRPSENSLIANNLTLPPASHKANVFGLPKPGVTAIRNLNVTEPVAFFVDWKKYDLRLSDNSPAIDAAALRLAPVTDIDGTPRPQGAGVDVGAYERR